MKMKKIIQIVMLGFMGYGSKAQSHTLDYDTCSQLQQYNNTEWMYINGTDTVRIYLRYHRSYESDFNYISDRLLGWHEYKRGNTIIESNYQQRFMTLPYDMTNIGLNDYSIRLRLDPASDVVPKGFRGFITDYGYANNSHLVTTTFNANATVMYWKQWFTEATQFNGPTPTMTLPKQFTLVRQ